MRIQHNTMAKNAYRSYSKNVDALKKDMERLSSGYRINRAGDDAAGLAISEKMRAQIVGLEAAQKNAKDGISLVQTAEGALTEVHDMLNRMVELATESANGTYDDIDRYQLQKEIDQLRTEINRIADSANFNNIKLLDGSLDAVNGTFTITETTTTVDHQYRTNVDLTVGGALPAVGSGTVLHQEGHQLFNSEVYVDLSGITWDTSDPDDKKLVIEVGDVTIELTADSDMGQISGNALIDAILGKVSDISVDVSDANGQVQFAADGSLTLKLDGKDVTVSAASGKNATLLFALKEEPASTDQALNGVQSVKVNGVKSAAAYAEYNFDLYTILSKGAFEKDSTVKIGGNTYIYDDTRWTTVQDFAEYVAGDISGTLAYGNFNIEYDNASGFKLTAQNVGNVNPPPLDITVQRVETVNNDPLKITSPGVNNTSAKYEFEFDLDLDNGEYLFIRTKKYETVNDILELAEKFPTDDTNDDYWSVQVSVNKNEETGLYKCSFTIEAVDSLLGGYAGAAGNTTGRDKLQENFKIYDRFDMLKGNQVDFENSRTVDGADGSRAEYYYVLPEDWIEETFKIGDETFDISESGNPKRIGGKSYNFSYDAANRRITLTAVLIGKDAAPPEITYRAIHAPDSTSAAGLVKPGMNQSRIDPTPFNSAGGKTEATVDRAAKTRFQLTADFVVAGAKLRIGEMLYEFISDSAKQGQKHDGKTTYVDVSSGSMARIAANLEQAAAGNGVWEVKADGDWIDFTETDRHANLDMNATLEDYRKGSGSDFDLSTAAGINKSLDYEGVLWHEYEEIVEKKEDFIPGKGLILQIGDTSDDFNQLEISIKDCHTGAMVRTDANGGKTSIDDISVADQESAQAAIDVIRNGINYVSDVRGQLGSYQNRLEHTINNLSVMAENIQDAESTIRDTDIPEVLMTYTKNNILIQSAQAMLAQANQEPQGVLQLLG